MSLISLARSVLPRGSRTRRFASGIYSRTIQATRRKRGVRSRFPTGEKFRLDPLFYNFDWPSAEPRVHTWLKENLKPGMTFFDVGAWVGSYSLVAARWVGTSGHVVSFEPSDAARTILLKHLQLNGFSDLIQVFDAVVGDEDGEVIFYERSKNLEASNSIAYRTALPHIERSMLSKTSKRMLRLDSFVATHRLVPNIVKIDVEGAEVRVLKGAIKMLASHRPTIICSLHPDWLPGLGDSVDSFFALVEEVGYRTFDFDGRELTSAGLEEVLLLPRAEY